MATYTVEYSRASEGLGKGRVREVPLTADAIDILEIITAKERGMLGSSEYSLHRDAASAELTGAVDGVTAGSTVALVVKRRGECVPKTCSCASHSRGRAWGGAAWALVSAAATACSVGRPP